MTHSALVPAACLTAALLAGCVAISGTPARPARTSLRIDGRAPASVLAPGETARIDKQIPPEYRGAVLVAEALGTVIYRHEHLATAATGMLTAKGRPAFSGAAAGWLTERIAGRLGVLFLVHAKGGVAVAAEVREGPDSGKPRITRWRTPRSLTPQEVLLWRARQLAFSAHITPCAKRYDPVVVPVHAAGVDQIHVYLLPVSSDPNRIFLGGYYRIVIGADGDRILATHAFTHACIALQRRPSSVAASVTELESDTPTAPQVYASLHYRFPIYVATQGNRLEWKVAQGSVTLIGPVDSR